VPKFRQRLLDEGTAVEAEIADIEARVAAELEEAVQFALASPQPDLSELYTDVYAAL
jgi:acetoin:2,6-dichlorophenolindophenol oxidoreductase subunit alpha